MPCFSTSEYTSEISEVIIFRDMVEMIMLADAS